MNFKRKAKANDPESNTSAVPSLEHIPLGPSSFPPSKPRVIPSKSSRKLVIWLVVLSILWVIILVAGGVLLIQSRQQQKLNDTQSGLYAIAIPKQKL